DAAQLSSEFDLIAAFLKPFPRGHRVRLGPGSDCAAVSVAPGMQLVATTDAVIEGVHFDLRRFSPEDVGWKALAVNLSDLAAAGLRSYPSPFAARAQRRPVPRVREGLLVAPFASAAIDISDGFLQDLGHICVESSVGAVVECSSLPLGKAARRLPDGMELAL